MEVTMYQHISQLLKAQERAWRDQAHELGGLGLDVPASVFSRCATDLAALHDHLSSAVVSPQEQRSSAATPHHISAGSVGRDGLTRVAGGYRLMELPVRPRSPLADPAIKGLRKRRGRSGSR
jgi:hypothetical protein